MNFVIYYYEGKRIGKKYHFYTKLQKDILAAPPSTIAIESSFSAGRWILDNKRAVLIPSTIKVLISLNDCQMAYNRSQDQPQPKDDEDEIDQFVQLSFSSGSEASGGSSANEAFDDAE